MLDYWPAYLAPDPAPIRPRIRAPAGSGRLCDGRTAAPNLQRRQWGASVAATHARAPSRRLHRSLTPEAAACAAFCCSGVNHWGRIERGRAFPLRGSIGCLSTSIQACSCSRPGDAVTFDDPRIRTRTKHTHADTPTHQTQAHTGAHTHTHTYTPCANLVDRLRHDGATAYAKFDSRCHPMGEQGGRGAAAVDGGIGFCRKEVGGIDVCAS